MNTNCNRIIFAGLFLLCAAAILPAGGKKEKPAVVQITGVVRLVGTVHFPRLVITGTDGEWQVADEEMDKLYDLQHQKVTVEGVETVTELKFANGVSYGERRELRNIKIIDTTP